MVWLLFALDLGSSQSRFSASRYLNSRMESVVLLHRSGARYQCCRISWVSEEMLDAMWRLAAVGTDVEAIVLLNTALI